MIPRVKFDYFDIPKIILGSDPFHGYTCLYPRPYEKKRIYGKRFSDASSIMRVILAAVKEGVNALSLGHYKNLMDAVDQIREKESDLIIIPEIYQIPLKLSGHHVLSDRIEATILRHREYIKQEPAYEEYLSTEELRKAETAKPLTNIELENLKVEKKKLGKLLNLFSEKRCVKLVTTCVELYALTNQLGLLEEIVETCYDFGFNVCAGFHMSNVLGILEKENFHFPAFYAPLNKIGFFMLPSHESMLQSLLKIKVPLIAIKPLGGGRVPPQEAFDYIFRLKDNIICMVGLSSVKEVNETIFAAKKSLHACTN